MCRADTRTLTASAKATVVRRSFTRRRKHTLHVETQTARDTAYIEPKT
jgi:hypothetical protein